MKVTNLKKFELMGKVFKVMSFHCHEAATSKSPPLYEFIVHNETDDGYWTLKITEAEYGITEILGIDGPGEFLEFLKNLQEKST